MIGLLTALACAPAAHAAAGPTDVMFLFDTSGSMSPVIEEAKAEMQEVMNHLRSTIPQSDFGVAEVKDTGEEEGGLYAWKLDAPITAETGAIVNAISGLSAEGGGDSPEAYGRGLYETDTNPAVGWRPGARHLIVLVADQVPHMANVNEGIAEEFWALNPFETGQELEAEAGIAGTQWKPGVDIQFLPDLKRLVEDEKPLEMVDYHDTEGDYIHYWEHWAALAGGSALEAGENGSELAARLISLVEAGVLPCASTLTAAPPSPSASGGAPTALTPRFHQPGSQVTVSAPTGTRFCPEDGIQVGDTTQSGFEASSGSTRVFRVPSQASSGIGVAQPGGSAALVPFEVDNFRSPWGFSIVNSAYTGADRTYDAHIPISRADLEAVFSNLGGPGAPAYAEAESDAREVLEAGLCYGFSLLSWELYMTAHGNSEPLGWANASGGLSLSAATEPISLGEEAEGSHALTHVLMRAAVSQYSPEAEERFENAPNLPELAAELDSGFSSGRPVPLLIHWSEGGFSFLKIGAKSEGHALLAYDYQPSGDGINVDVVDPNVPEDVSSQAEAFPRLQVHVNPDGSWSFPGSFQHGTYGDPISQGGGSLQAIPTPRLPGGLNLPSTEKHWWDVLAPAKGDTISSISYTRSAGKGFPADVKQQLIADDVPIDRLLVPSSHSEVTVSLSGPKRKGAAARLTAPGYLDEVKLDGSSHQVTVHSATGSLSVPAATSGTELDVTRVTDGVQRTVRVRFSGVVKDATVTMSPSGQATISGAGGRGHASITLATYMPEGRRAVTPRSSVSLVGRAKVHRHTPKVKRRRHHRHGHHHRRRRARRRHR